MIYILFGVIVILVLYVGFLLVKRAQITRELNIEKSNVRFAKEDIKVLKYNYTSLKKVYQSLLKKNKSLDMEHKKLQKLYKLQKSETIRKKR